MRPMGNCYPFCRGDALLVEFSLNDLLMIDMNSIIKHMCGTASPLPYEAFTC